MKYPVLIVGVVMFLIFLNDHKTKIWWNEISLRYIPSTCISLKDRISPKAPSHWTLKCSTTEDMILEVKFEKVANEDNNTRALYYRALANELKTFSLFANPETLTHLRSLKMILKGDRLSVIAQTDGEALVRLSQINDKDLLAQHLKLTVKVKEIHKVD